MASSFYNSHSEHTVKSMGRWIVLLLLALLFVCSIPTLYRTSLKHVRRTTPVAEQFPVTVNPQQRLILESDAVNKILEAPNSPLQASAY
ncbi:MAG: Endolytic transglycosylase MltG, partial [Parcubacteria group bacterium]|nr:Endolytic transglycosylase MltG [Parcubacteria group bacterium]